MDYEEEKLKAMVHTAAVKLGHKGGMKRAAKLSPERRSEIARKAAEARWQKTKTEE